MKRSKEIFLLGMLAVSLCMISGCSEETKQEGKAEQEGSSASVQQMSNVVSNVSDDGEGNVIQWNRSIQDSIENYFPQLTFLEEEEKKALVAEETEWKALLLEMDRLQSEIVKIYDEDKTGSGDLYEKYEAAQRAHLDLRWKMHNASPENRELSDEEQIRKSTVLTEEEKELLLKDEAVIRELQPEISKIREKIWDKVNPLEQKREELSEKIVAVHEKNRAIWDKMEEKGLRLEISTSYLPPIDSEQWFQKK